MGLREARPTTGFDRRRALTMVLPRSRAPFVSAALRFSLVGILFLSGCATSPPELHPHRVGLRPSADGHPVHCPRYSDPDRDGDTDGEHVTGGIAGPNAHDRPHARRHSPFGLNPAGAVIRGLRRRRNWLGGRQRRDPRHDRRREELAVRVDRHALDLVALGGRSAPRMGARVRGPERHRGPARAHHRRRSQLDDDEAERRVPRGRVCDRPGRLGRRRRDH